MTPATPASAGPSLQHTLKAAIFDVDGVLLASPHEQAWREALEGFADPARLTPEIYEAAVAGKPRLAGARAVLEALGLPDAARHAPLYAERKQKLLENLIRLGRFSAFPDAVSSGLKQGSNRGIP